ncbi:hypothetical protein P43SY_010558 [Pythium insidiosum]|uniref:Acyltransferase 3 domain-containing protein n=1 Tax=Pythium insidiosum TaxID=114742 RepID=A0AAD5QA01_PYTIN|nr:hypothetical protein P43SY_010558 [Pythium insidiosum]
MLRANVVEPLDGVLVSASSDADHVALLVRDHDARSPRGVATSAGDDDEVDKTKKLKANTPNSANAANASNKIPCLDGLRGLAAYFVIVQHSHWGDRNFGAYGVDIFFVLSSFLLTMLFDKKVRQLIDRRARWYSWVFALLDYFQRRFLRVYPLFFAVATLLWILPNDTRKHYWGDIDQRAPFDYFKVLIFDADHRFHVFWTLPVEIHYYFIIPIFVIGVALLRQWWWTPLVPLSYWCVQEGFMTFRGDHEPLRPHLNTFVSGSIAAIVFNRIDAWRRKHAVELDTMQLIAFRAVEYGFLLLLLSVMYDVAWDWLGYNPLPKSPSPYLSGFLAVVMMCELLVPGPLSGVFEWNVLLFFGKISYSMYMLHSFVVFHPLITPQSGYSQRVATLTSCSLLGLASYHLIEVPSQRLTSGISQFLKVQELVASKAAVTTAH